MSSLITDVYENPCVKRCKRDSVGRLYFFTISDSYGLGFGEALHAFSLLETYMHLYLKGHPFKMVATLDFIFLKKFR